MKIKAYIINGEYEDHLFNFEYSPTIRLPKKDVELSLGRGPLETHDLSKEYVGYRECFRSVDGLVVLYSLNGEGNDLLRKLAWEFLPMFFENNLLST